jgi:glucan phosphoethanolaminetransferase (alkaline phosphatase superfamily)
MSYDPTRLSNQPALTTASGTSWLIIGGLFSGISIAVLAVLATVAARGLAWGSIAAIIGLYAAMFIVRFTVGSHRRRLRIIAACFLMIAFVGLGSVVTIAAVNWAAL